MVPPALRGILLLWAAAVNDAKPWCSKRSGSLCRGRWNSWEGALRLWDLPGLPEGADGFAYPVDWDVDGDVDLFLAGTHSGTAYTWETAKLSFYERLSDGSLLQQNVSGALQQLEVLVGTLDLADWDGDGKPDVLACQRRGDDVYVLTWVAHDGSSNATLLEFGSDEYACWVPEAADWDGDGDQDLFLGTRNGTVRFFERLSPAPGALQERRGVDHPLGGMSFASHIGGFGRFASPEAADWDGDGDLDLFVVLPRAVESFERQQDGRLLQVTYGHGPWPEMVAEDPNAITHLKMIDWDGDGDLDAFVNWRSDSHEVYAAFELKLRSTSLRFVEVAAEEQPLPVPQDLGYICGRLADWDGDGVVDVLLGDERGNIAVHRRLLDGSYVLWQQLDNAVSPCNGQLFDWDASGTVDLVTYSYQSGCVVWQSGLPGGTLGPPMTVLCLGNSVGKASFECTGKVNVYQAIAEVLDWNSDGVPDIILSSGCVAIMQGTDPANRTFMWEQLPDNLNGFLQAVDVDSDGDYDLVRLDVGDTYNISIYDRRPNNSLVFKETLPLGSHGGPYEWMLVAFDMQDADGDGNPEVLISHFWRTPGYRGQPSDPMLNMRYWTSGCLGGSACSGHGTCSPTTSRCSCADGYDDIIGDCSRCAAGYHTVVDARKLPVLQSRVCAQCAGLSALGWCQGRGTCQDDAAAAAAASNLSKPLVGGSGTCVCRDAAFGGADCGEGQCPVWRAEGTGGACELSVMYFGMAFVFGVLSLGAWLLMPMLLSAPLVVQEVSWEDSRVIVTVGWPHNLLTHPVASVRVRFWNTGHPDLDKAEQPFRVRVMDRERFLLLDHKGVAVNSRVDSSMGFVQVDRLRAAWCFGIARMPVAVIMMSLVGGASVAAWRGNLGRLTPFALVVATGVVAAFAVVRQRGRCVTPLGRKLADFGKVLAVKNSNPQPCDQAAGRALRAGQLWELVESFSAFIRDRNSYYVSENIVKPLTRKRELSYAELAGPSQVTWFVSHFWGMATRLLAESIKGHATQIASRMGAEWKWEQVTYWVCTFSNNQWKVKEEIGEDCESSSFYSALCSADCRGTAMVLDEDAHPLSRAWCLYEVFLTCQRSSPQNQSSQQNHFEGLQLCTPSGVLGGRGAIDIAIEVGKKLAKVDLEQAKATKPEDEKNIKQKVREVRGGFPAVNRFVRENIRQCLSKVQQAFENSLSEVVAQLGEPGTPPGATAAAPLLQGPTLLVGRAATAPHLACGSPNLSPLAASPCEGDGKAAGGRAG